MKKWITAVSVVFLLMPLPSMAQILKVESGKVKLYDYNGSYKRQLPVTDAVNASTNGDLIAVVFIDGKVKLYDSNGSYKRQLPVTDAVGVAFSGNDIVVTFKDGKVKIYDTNGSYKRQI
jgi:WD40 repeat protein